MATYDSAGVLAQVTGTECHIAAYDKSVDIPSHHKVTETTGKLPRPSFPGFGFLILAPTLSTDYPSQFSSRASSINSTTSPAPAISSSEVLPTSAIDDTTPADPAEHIKKDRRSSSVSSTGAFRRRILKLGPVHNGGEPGVSDYVEIEE
jgi:hypothetical protein